MVGAAVVVRVVDDAVVAALVVVIIGVVVVIIMDAKVLLRQLVELQHSTEQFVWVVFPQLMEQEALHWTV